MEELTKTIKELNDVKTRELRLAGASATRLLGIIKTQEDMTKRSRISAKMSDKANKTKLKSIEMTEYHIRLRHRLNTDLENTHAEQVRRNIRLRDTSQKFNNVLGFVTNSLKGGFGFGAAITKITKDSAQVVKKFNELRDSATNLKKAEEKRNEMFNRAVAAQHRSASGSAGKETIEDLNSAQGEVVQAQDRSRDAQDTSGLASNKHLKPLLGKLSKMGEMFSKHSVPIMLGLGVAGILMSVVVKALSASPLFQQMMKLMKFMVTLILMPIGTFFGALLRPILIMLLRKVIVPMFSTWMPRLMKAGTDLGKFISKLPFIGGDHDGSGGLTKNEWDELDIGEKILTGGAQVADTILTGGESSPKAYGSEDDSYDNYGNETPSNGEEIVTKGGIVWINGTPYYPAPESGGGEAISNEEVNKTAGDPVRGDADYVGAAEKSYRERIKKENEEEWKRMMQIAAEQLRMNTNPAITKQEEIMRKQMEEWATKTGQFADKVNLATTSVVDTEKSYRNLIFAIEDATPKTQEERDAEKGISTGYSSESQAILDSYALYKASGTSARDIAAGGGSSGYEGKNYTNYKYASGGVINEPVVGRGLNSGASYTFGEAGSEVVTPMGKSGGGTNITINIQNMSGSNSDIQKLRQTILNVIQESSNNRGRM